MCSKLGAKHVLTTAYHPQQTGGEIPQATEAVPQDRECGQAWLDHLPWALLGIRAAPKEDSAVSSAEAIFNTPLTIPSQAQKMMQTGGIQPDSPPLIALRQWSYAEVAGGQPSLLDNMTHVYIRWGTVGGPLLQRPL